MNEKINLCEILKDCPKGTKLYSTIYGYVEFDCIKEKLDHPVVIYIPKLDRLETFTSDGRIHITYEGECILFPSKGQRDWSKWVCPKTKKPKFGPKTLNPFDRVLVLNYSYGWCCDVFSHYESENKDGGVVSGGFFYSKVIPYNEETKHLVGTIEDAPEFYRYWED